MFDERELDEEMKGGLTEDAGRREVPDAHREFAIAAGRAWGERMAELGPIELAWRGSCPHEAVCPVLWSDEAETGCVDLLRAIASQAARDRWMELVLNRRGDEAWRRETRAYVSSATHTPGGRC